MNQQWLRPGEGGADCAEPPPNVKPASASRSARHMIREFAEPIRLTDMPTNRHVAGGNRWIRFGIEGVLHTFWVGQQWANGILTGHNSMRVNSWLCVSTPQPTKEKSTSWRLPCS